MATLAARGATWSLHRAFLAVSYALVVVAFVPIAVSGELGWTAPAAFTAAILTSLLRDPRASPPRPATARVWTAVVLTAFVAAVYWASLDGLWLLHAIEFALLVTVSRLFQRRFAKDHLQLFGLSFILLLVAAIVQPGPMFAVCFLAYAVLTMWGLTLLHLVREIEIQTLTGPEHLLPPPSPKRRWFGLRGPKRSAAPVEWPDLPVHASTLEWRSRRLVGPRYLAATSVLALGVLAGSALFFFLFPRLGVGFFFAQTRPPRSVIGFSTEAELGRFGALKSNAEVVARVTFPDDPQRLHQSLRLRGVAFDRFGTTGWTRTREEAWPMRLAGQSGPLAVPRAEPPEAGRDRSWRAEIYLEPIDPTTRVLFAPPRTWAVELLDTRFDIYRDSRRRRQVLRTASGDLSYHAPPDTALHYAVDVVEPLSEASDVGRLRLAGDRAPQAVRSRYTELPPTLDPRIPALARTLAGDAATAYDKAVRIEAALRTQWQYSLQGDQDAAKPLEDFLFGKKSGHCEYFATAMALMLRALDVPARPVHGFVGGQYNPIGQYRMVRQADAHAWVEVFFPRVGWRTFDPTPPSGQEAPADSGVMVRLRQLADGASLLWYQWVVEYDLDRQVEAFRSVGGWLKSLQRSDAVRRLSQGAAAPQPGAEQRSARLPVWAAVVLGALAVALAARLAWSWWRRRAAAVFEPAVERRLSRLHRALAGRGWDRRPHETWHAVARRVGAAAPPAHAALVEFATCYDRARFAAAPGGAARDALIAAADGARRAVRSAPGQRRRWLGWRRIAATALSLSACGAALPAQVEVDPLPAAGATPTVADVARAWAVRRADEVAPVAWDGDLPGAVGAALLFAYRATLSASDLDVCAFEPSCSRFAELAVARHGWIRGVLLGADRLLRDHPGVPHLGYRPTDGGRRFFDPVDGDGCAGCGP